LQALEFSLQNERIDLVKDASEKQSELILLTGDTLARAISPVIDEGAIKAINAEGINFPQLLDSALLNRYDLLAANELVNENELNLKLQKAQRIPDLTLGANYDRAGSYVTNYNSLSLSFPIPLLNRNQGNIRMAQFQLDQGKQLQLQMET